MKVGFTGTRVGMSQHQREHFEKVLQWLRPEEFHHGGADGADAEAAEVVGEKSKARIVVHRPKRLNAEELLARNRLIVAEADILIAVPESDTEQQRSGTWATVRYAREKGIPVLLLTRAPRAAKTKPKKLTPFDQAWAEGKVKGL